jgi:cytochrome c oxidase accessory protein FixG
VQVCPTGIDIRKGLQHECIGCAACIDACDQVMDRMGYARGLIRYTTENALERRLPDRARWRRVLRPRTVVYSHVLFAIIGVAAWSLATRVPLRVDVLRDRGALARETVPGQIENVYRVQIMNTDERARRYTIKASGLPGLRVVGVDHPIEVEAASARLLALRLQLPLEPGDGNAAPTPGAHKIEIEVESVRASGEGKHDDHDDPVERHERSTFIVPR